jgi:hypothetical protein
MGVGAAVRVHITPLFLSDRRQPRGVTAGQPLPEGVEEAGASGLIAERSGLIQDRGGTALRRVAFLRYQEGLAAGFGVEPPSRCPLRQL